MLQFRGYVHPRTESVCNECGWIANVMRADLLRAAVLQEYSLRYIGEVNALCRFMKSMFSVVAVVGTRSNGTCSESTYVADQLFPTRVHLLALMSFMSFMLFMSFIAFHVVRAVRSLVCCSLLQANPGVVSRVQ